MFEYNQKYKRGRKTLIFIFIQKGWWLTVIGIGFLILSAALSFGSVHDSVETYLLEHPDLYLTTGMLSLWFFLLGLSFIFVAYLRANVLYRHYKFMLDEYALYLHRGLFFIKETTIPYKHISNVHIERPYHYRMFGIAKLDIVTTAHSNPNHVDVNRKLLIPVIDLSVARALSKFLLQGSIKPATKPQHHKDFLEENIVEEDDQFEVDNGPIIKENSSLNESKEDPSDLFSDEAVEEFNKSIRNNRSQ